MVSVDTSFAIQLVNFIVFLHLIFIYCIPLSIAIFRRQDIILISIINIFVGWTLIGWDIALFMALRNKNGIFIKNNDYVNLEYIISAIKQINIYLNSVSKKEFQENKLLQDGVLRQLKLIEIASSRISKKLKQRNNSIPWDQITEHSNIDIVWEITQEDLSLLENQVNMILSDM